MTQVDPGAAKKRGGGVDLGAGEAFEHPRRSCSCTKGQVSPDLFYRAIVSAGDNRLRLDKGDEAQMNRLRQAILLAGGLLAGSVLANDALAQKPGGVLKMYFFDSPASMSIHEEATIAGQGPMMGVFNNLVMYDQHIAQTSINTIVPDLASEWAWDEDKTGLTFKLRQGVKWHDGKPFTAKDVKCTMDLLQGKSADKLRLNPRKAWYRNLEEVVTNGDYEVTFRLKRPQPAFVALLASGFSPVYPCHVSPAQMRQHPIGAGPFKFVEFRPNESIKVARNPDYWKKDQPYLDAIE